MPAPWPIAPPVTMATLPVSRPMVSLSSTVSCMIESAAKPTDGSRSEKNSPSWRSRSGRSQTAPVASNRCSTTGAATRATMPPYTTKTWPVIRSAAGEAR